jgi:hypothetical protein
MGIFDGFKDEKVDGKDKSFLKIKPERVKHLIGTNSLIFWNGIGLNTA